LSKGLGRAALHVKHYGVEEYADVLLDACLHNKVYDQQCEDSRGEWLFSMIYKTSRYEQFRVAILQALKTETKEYDLSQLCELVRYIAKQGDAKAEEGLKTFIFKNAAEGESDWLGIDDILALGKSEDVLALARLFGRKLMNDPDYSAPFMKDDDLHEYENVLEEHAYSDEEIRTYLEYLQESRSDYKSLSDQERQLQRALNREQFRNEFPLARIIDDSQNSRNLSMSKYRRFGMYAERDELDLIFDNLIKTKDDVARTRLLWIFEMANIPRLAPALFTWAWGEDKELKKATIWALTRISDERVHELARAKLRAGKITDADCWAMDLFINNFESSDAEFIMAAILSKHLDINEIHSIAMSLTKIAEQNETVGLETALNWAYENTPCMNCRYDAVKGLKSIDKLKSEIIEECLYDGSEEIRTFAQGIALTDDSGEGANK
jgi:hypothetical protein